jgi:hypothetical protein
MATATAIKRLVGDHLYLSDVDGTPWATNRYWLAPASRISPLLEKFNVSPTDTGSYDVNGSVRKRSDDSPKVGQMLDIRDYRDLLAPVKVSGHDAYVNVDGEYVALFTRADTGDYVGVVASWLEWLADAPAGYGERYGPARYMAAGSIARVAIVADREIEHGGHIGDDGKFVPVTWETTGPVILAVVMSRRVSD